MSDIRIIPTFSLCLVYVLPPRLFLYLCRCSILGELNTHTIMSKGNLFMGNASGKLADVVLYRNAGAQVARLRVRKPHNPQTELQRIQRVIQSTNAKAYSVLQSICNHSFEGMISKIDNQSEFMKENVKRDRQRVNVAPMGWRMLSAFNAKDMTEALCNNYIISKGQLPTIVFGSDGANVGNFVTIGSGLSAMSTYADIVDNLNLVQGDQITIVVIEGDTATKKMRSLYKYRFILEPNDGVMTTTFVDGNGKINKPNIKNECDLSVSFSGGALKFEFPFTPVAIGVIASRYQDGKWLRSECRLMAPSNSALTLGDAVDSYLPNVASTKYLNQADTSF